jgi:hypothetical protein
MPVSGFSLNRQVPAYTFSIRTVKLIGYGVL